MTSRATIWTGATLTSLAVNFAMVGIIWFALLPRTFSDQTPDPPEISISAYAIPEKRATASDASGDVANSVDARGRRTTANNAVAQSRASAVSPDVAELGAADVSGASARPSKLLSTPAPIVAGPGKSLSQSVATEIVTEAVSAPAHTADPAHIPAKRTEAITVVAQAADAVLADASRLDAIGTTQSLVQVSAAIEITAVITAPAAIPTDVSAPKANVLPVIANAAIEIIAVITGPTAMPTKVSVPHANVLPVIAGTAISSPTTLAELPAVAKTTAISVAFAPGNQNFRIDPVSLAAIQSFMQPGDARSSDSDAGTARDAIGSLLASVPCARLQAEFLPDSGTMELRGHVPEESMRAPVLNALSQYLGATIPVADNVRILPPPQCEALAGISSVGLPQSNDQRSDPRLVGESAHARSYGYASGQRMIFDIAAPDYDAFIYVDYFDAQGQVVHLVPNERVRLELLPAKKLAKIGAERADGNFLQVTVGPPYGQEIAVAFASSHSLYSGSRPIQELATPYLAFLQQQVAAARTTHPDFRGEWVYFFVETTE